MDRRIRLIWSPNAKDDLKSIQAYVAAEDRQAARRLIAKLKESVKLLPGLPEMGRKVPEYNRPDIRERIFGTYRIIYRRQPEQIDILAVWHTAQEKLPEL